MSVVTSDCIAFELAKPKFDPEPGKDEDEDPETAFAMRHAQAASNRVASCPFSKHELAKCGYGTKVGEQVC